MHAYIFRRTFESVNKHFKLTINSFATHKLFHTNTGWVFLEQTLRIFYNDLFMRGKVDLRNDNLVKKRVIQTLLVRKYFLVTFKRIKILGQVKCFV